MEIGQKVKTVFTIRVGNYTYIDGKKHWNFKKECIKSFLSGKIATVQEILKHRILIQFDDNNYFAWVDIVDIESIVEN